MGAHENFKQALAAGEDGKKDWKARKVCNYFEESYDDCGKILYNGDCKTEKEVTELKAKHNSKLLANVQSKVKNWDTEKCETIKSLLQTLNQQESDNNSEETPVGLPETAKLEETGNEDNKADNENTNAASNKREELITLTTLALIMFFRC